MNKFKKLKYRHKVGAIIFIFALLPLIIMGSFFIGKLWNSKVEEILAKNKTQLLNSVNDIDSLLQSNVNKIIYINNNYYINNFLENNFDQNLVGIMSFSDYLQTIMLAIKADNSSVDINIYSLTDTNYNGDYLRSLVGLGGANSNEWESVRDEILGYDNDKIIWKYRSLNGKQNIDEVKDYICAYKKISNMTKPLAIIEIRIPFDEIAGKFQYDIPKGSFIVYNMENSKKWDLVNEGTVGKESISELEEANLSGVIRKDYYAINVDLKAGIGKMSMYIPKKLIFEELKYYLLTIILTLFIITIILFFSVEIAAFFLTKKLEGLFLKMNTNIESLIKNENPEIFADEDEFGTIENKFHELIQKIKEHYQEVNEYELERKSLETKLLQERINPHFLYNTLSTLKWITEDKRVQNVIDSMVKYYRIALNKGSSIVTIYQELEMIREYLKLQIFAYGNELEFKIEIEDGIGKFLILKHLLQPVVENAVLHGVNGRETGGVIMITVKSCVNQIIFKIFDNGIGMEQDKIEEILSGTSNKIYGGYGMRNIQKRMEIFYGKDSGLHIESVKNQGTTVTITIPSFLDSDIHSSMKER
ncbi:MAG TPA: histidine kinase [Ruminiclostridium sp.]